MQDMRHFKAMLRKVDNTFVKDLALKVEDMASLQAGMLVQQYGASVRCLPAYAAAVHSCRLHPQLLPCRKTNSIFKPEV